MVSMADLQREQAWRATGFNDFQSRVDSSAARVSSLQQRGVPLEIISCRSEASREQAAAGLKATRSTSSKPLPVFGELNNNPHMDNGFVEQQSPIEYDPYDGSHGYGEHGDCVVDEASGLTHSQIFGEEPLFRQSLAA